MHFSSSIVVISSVVFCLLSSQVSAETKQIISKASYTMGDGETASFAEAMVLQKAKQIALEEAGTYVEAYTKAINQDLTLEEIKTIAGGVLQTEIMSLTRTLVGDGLRFDIRIKAVVTTDKMEELAHRIRGTNAPREYDELQKKYGKLATELEFLKRSILAVGTLSPDEKETKLNEVHNKIHEVEREFRLTQTTENSLYRRLLSGEELANELQKQIQADRERKEKEARQREDAERSLQAAIKTLQEEGHKIEVSAPHVINKDQTVGLEFKIVATASEAGLLALRQLEKKEDGLAHDACERLNQAVDQLGLFLAVILKDGTQYTADRPAFHSYRKNFCWYDWKNATLTNPKEAVMVIDLPAKRINEVVSVEGHIRPDPGRQDVKPAFQQEARIPQTKAPQTQLKVLGSSGSNPFWGRVEAMIKSHWEPPPIDVTGQTYSAVVRFRFFRNGTVKDVVIQQTSGNSYFDMAGQRAILKPRQFPVFPPDIIEAYQDLEMVFKVGELGG
jgi:hypothetical protein